MRWSSLWFMVVMVVAGCAENHAGPATSEPPPAKHDDPAMVSPEAYDDLQQVFRGKRAQVVECYDKLISSGKLDKKARGRVTFEMNITTSGEIRDLHASGDTLASKDLEDCLVNMISKWPLPPPNVAVGFSYSYEFEP